LQDYRFSEVSLSAKEEAEGDQGEYSKGSG